MNRNDAQSVASGPDMDVVWLNRGNLLDRSGSRFRTFALCALATSALSAAVVLVGFPPGVPVASASVPARAELADTLSNGPPIETVLASLAGQATAPAGPRRPGLTGDAAASLSRDPAATVLDKVSPEAMTDAVEASVGADPDEVLSFGPMRIRRWLVATILRAARETGMDPVLLMAIADKESSFVTHVKARTSSAEGLYQFIARTWLKVVREYGAAHGLASEAALVTVDADGYGVQDAAERARILEMRRDPYLAAVLAAEMLRHDAARIAARIGRELTHGEIYIAHFLGPDDAETFLAKVVASPGSTAASLLPRPARANRPIFYAAGRRRARGLSVAQVHRKFEDMMGLRAERYRGVAGTSGALAYASADAGAP